MLVTRYLFKNLFTVTVFVAMTLTMVVWLTQSLKLLELVANSDAPPSLFIQLVLLLVPKFLEIILPLSLVIAVFFIYNKFIMDNELIVLRACGIDQYALGRAAIILAISISLFVTVLGAWVSPMCAMQLQKLRQTVQTQYSTFLLREGVFNSFGDKLTVYLKARESNGDMVGLMIHDTRNKSKPPITIMAKKGRVVMDSGVPTIIVIDGLRQQMDADNKFVSKLYFSRYAIEINGLEGVVEERWRNAKERTLYELFTPDMNNKRDRDNADDFLVEGIDRLISPWNALSYALVALATILLGPFNRRGQRGRILFGVIIVGALQALNMSLIHLSKKHLGVLPLAFLNTLIPILVGFYVLHPAGEQKVKALMRRWHLFANRSLEAAAS